MAYKGFTALFPLVTTSYISHVLLPEGVGKVAYANTIVAYFVLLASLGLPSYGVKAIAQNDETKEQRSRTFFELFFINLAATLLCIAAYYVFVTYFPHFADRRELFWVMGLLLILNIFNIDWFYQGMEEYTYIATRSFVVKIASFVLMLLFVKDSGDYLIYAFILCLATAGNNLLNAFELRKYVTLSVLFPKKNGNAAQSGMRMGQHLRPVLILLASTIATEVYTMLDTVMLEYYHGDVSVGYYSNAVKIVRMTYTVVIALVAVFYPRISMYYKQGRQEACNELLSRGTQILLLLALPCTVGLLLTADLDRPSAFRRGVFAGSWNASDSCHSGARVFDCLFFGAYRFDGNRKGAYDFACHGRGCSHQYSGKFPVDPKTSAGRSGGGVRAFRAYSDSASSVVCKGLLYDPRGPQLSVERGRSASCHGRCGAWDVRAFSGHVRRCAACDRSGSRLLCCLSAAVSQRAFDGADPKA